MKIIYDESRIWKEVMLDQEDWFSKLWYYNVINYLIINLWYTIFKKSSIRYKIQWRY